MLKKLFLLLCCSLLFAISRAQEPAPARFKTEGFLVGYGPTFSDNTNYRVYYLTGDWSWSFSKPKRRDFLSIYFEPQVNLVRTDRPWDMEFGANLGLRNYVRINDGFYFYQMLGSGPHFITAELDRQATGFIFSDNLALGVLKRMDKELMLNLQFGVRHISNAGLKLPNRGVNTLNFRVGLSRRK